MTKEPKKKKSLFRRILKGTGITFLILIILLSILPIIFKKQIIQFAKDEANSSLNAKVNFGDFDLSLITSFPSFKLSIADVSVANIGDFEGDTLLYAQNLSVKLNLMSVIKGDNYEINSIIINKPRIHALVLKNGKSNWDITKPSTDVAKPEAAKQPSKFKMSLKKFQINNAYIVYNDAKMNVKAELYNMTNAISGDFTTDNFLMETLTEIEKLTVNYGGITYFNKVKTRLKVNLDADMPNFKFTFKENEFSFNELTLGLDGYFAMPKKDMDMDLKFKANQTEFKNILSLVPGVYTKDFKDVKTSGTLALNGYAKGIYNDKKLPAFGIKLLIANAMFQYPSLPKSATNIQVDLAVDNKTGVTDATVIDLNKFHVEMAGNPVDATMHVSTPVSDANIAAQVKAKINLASVKDVIPLEKGDDLTGLVAADIKMKGRMSSIEKKEYEKFDAQGNLSIDNMNYKSASLNYPTQINKLALAFSSKSVELTKLSANVGRSDFQMDGRIDNFIQYAFKNELLKGTFNLKSSLIDANEFTATDKTKPAATPAKVDTTKMSVVEVPSNLDVILNAAIGKILYDNLEITNVSGGVGVKDSKLTLDKLKMEMKQLEGTMILNGVYSTQNIKKPSIDFDADISNFDIPKTFVIFSSVQKLAPIAKYAKGKFSTQIKFTSNLDQHMSPDLKTLSGGGRLQTANVTIDGFEPINKLADALKQPKYKKLTFENVNATYEFKDGRVQVQEMPIKSGNITGKVKGSTGFDQTIDYNWNLEIPSSELGSQANALAGNLLDQANKKAGTNMKVPDKIKVNATFGGTITKPTIKLGNFNSGESTKDQVKDVVNKGVDAAKDKAKEESDKIMKDAQAQADKLKAEAQALADKTKTEGYKAIDDNINNIGNPIAKMTAKAAAPAAKQEVDKKAQKIVDEANNKANDILNKAKAESDKKLAH